MSLAVAIIGSGPAGFYAAEALRAKFADCRIDILERLPTPFGLIRAGVAPDHLTTKNVVKVFEKVLDQPGVRLLANVEVGRDVTVDELKKIYDVIVVAVGAQQARPLNVPGEALDGVVNVIDFVGWYNGVPGAPDCTAALDGCRAAAVIGNGNVSLDVARVLAKTAEELDKSDIVPAVARTITAAPLTDIYVIGRRGPVQSSFSFPELSEFGKLSEAVPLVAPEMLPEDASAAPEADRKKKERTLKVFRGFADNRPDQQPVRVHFLFLASPAEILGEDGRVSGLRLVRNRLVDGRAEPTEERFTLDVQLVVPAIGYRLIPIDGLPHDSRKGIVANHDGRVEPGVYVVGWAKRGPTGVIGTNRVDSRSVVELIAADDPKPRKPGPKALDELLGERRIPYVDTEGWRRLDAAETARGAGGRPRVKITSFDEALRVLSSN